MSVPSHKAILYFSFSLTLAPELTRERLQAVTFPALPVGEVAEALDVSLIHDVPSPDWDGRVARLVDAPGQRIPGLLRTLSPQEGAALARLEQRLALATVEREVRVRTASGAQVTARAFTPPAVNPAPRGPVSVSFLVALARAAERAGLPADYVERLQAEAHLVQSVQRAQADKLR
jgi:hypothetical protein